jgi:small subunit ribosomal protein S20
MANTASAKKAIRSSARKRHHNAFWKGRIQRAMKDLKKTLLSKDGDVGILNTQQSALQKVLDKAAKEGVIHKNKADRLKARYAKKVTAQNTKISGSKGAGKRKATKGTTGKEK